MNLSETPMLTKTIDISVKTKQHPDGKCVAIGFKCPDCNLDIWHVAPPSKQKLAAPGKITYCCTSCTSANMLKYRAENSAKVSATQTKYRAENSAKVKQNRAKYYQENSDKEKSTTRARRGTDTGKRANRQYAAKHRTAKMKAAPPWADKTAVKQVYANCPDGYQVDHIVPLQGKKVSGLHVPANLQYLPANVNASKCNRFEIE